MAVFLTCQSCLAVFSACRSLYTGAMANDPAAAEAILAFLNTLDVDAGQDELASADTFGAWLKERAVDVADGIGNDALQRARELRDALRALARANHDSTTNTEAFAAVNRIAESLPLALRFAADGQAELVPRVDGLDGYLAGLLANVFLAIRDGTWTRIKICAADDCQWAFIDASKNRSRAWCSMRICGNRAKVRNYQRRQKARQKGNQR